MGLTKVYTAVVHKYLSIVNNMYKTRLIIATLLITMEEVQTINASMQ